MRRASPRPSRSRRGAEPGTRRERRGASATAPPGSRARGKRLPAPRSRRASPPARLPLSHLAASAAGGGAAPEWESGGVGDAAGLAASLTLPPRRRARHPPRSARRVCNRAARIPRTRQTAPGPALEASLAASPSPTLPPRGQRRRGRRCARVGEWGSGGCGGPRRVPHAPAAAPSPAPAANGAARLQPRRPDPAHAANGSRPRARGEPRRQPVSHSPTSRPAPPGAALRQSGGVGDAAGLAAPLTLPPPRRARHPPRTARRVCNRAARIPRTRQTAPGPALEASLAASPSPTLPPRGQRRRGRRCARVGEWGSGGCGGPRRVPHAPAAAPSPAPAAIGAARLQPRRPDPAHAANGSRPRARGEPRRQPVSHSPTSRPAPPGAALRQSGRVGEWGMRRASPRPSRSRRGAEPGTRRDRRGASATAPPGSRARGKRLPAPRSRRASPPARLPLSHSPTLPLSHSPTLPLSPCVGQSLAPYFTCK